MKSMLAIEGLSKSYDGKKFALSNCRFQVEAGGICAVVGESGSGKTTLFRLIAGLERPNEGRVSIKGEVVSDDSMVLPPQERNVGYVFQDFALFPHLTVSQNISFGLKSYKKETVNKMLSLIKMEEYAQAYPSQLSGGQEQRVALARTLAVQPELLLLDEPFSNLDVGLKSSLRQEIRGIVKEMGTTMMFVTHDLFDALDIAEEIIFLKDGHMLQHSSITDFAKEMEHPEVLQMVADLSTDARRMLEVMAHREE